MTDRLAAAVEAIRRLPAERQALAADVLENIVSKEAVGYRLSDEQLAEVELSIREADTGDFASEAEVAAFLVKLGK